MNVYTLHVPFSEHQKGAEECVSRPISGRWVYVKERSSSIKILMQNALGASLQRHGCLTSSPTNIGARLVESAGSSIRRGVRLEYTFRWVAMTSATSSVG